MRHNNKGLTLIEVILSLALGLMVMSLVYGFWHTVVFSDQKIKDSTTYFRQLRLSIDALQGDLMRFVTYSAPISYKGSTLFDKDETFNGTNKRIEFLAALEDGVNLVVYEIGRPDWGTVHKVIIGKHVQKMQQVVNISSTDDRVFLIRGQALLKDVLANKQEVKATQIVFGPFNPSDLTWSFLYPPKSASNSTAFEEFTQTAGQSGRPKALKLSLNLLYKSDKQKNLETVVLLP